MLSPLGTSTIKFDNLNSISSTENSLEFEDEDDVWDATHHPSSQPIGKSRDEMNLEDLISTPNANNLEAPTPSSSVYLTIEAQDGTKKKVHKACVLKVLFQEIVNKKGSTDQQKCIQGLTHYSVKPNGTLDSPANNKSIFGESICVGNPAVTLVIVDWLAFLAVIQLSSIKLSNGNV